MAVTDNTQILARVMRRCIKNWAENYWAVMPWWFRILSLLDSWLRKNRLQYYLLGHTNFHWQCCIVSDISLVFVTNFCCQQGHWGQGVRGCLSSSRLQACTGTPQQICIPLDQVGVMICVNRRSTFWSLAIMLCLATLYTSSNDHMQTDLSVWV